VKYKICSKMQQQVYLKKKFIKWTNRHYGMAGMALTSSITQQTSGVTSPRVFNLTADYTHIYFNVLLRQKLQVSWCYCVKYIRISLLRKFYAVIISLFTILQGSVATYVRCGGKRDRPFIANFLLSLAVKVFWKSATFGKVMHKTRVECFFTYTAF